MDLTKPAIFVVMRKAISNTVYESWEPQPLFMGNDSSADDEDANYNKLDTKIKSEGE